MYYQKTKLTKMCCIIKKNVEIKNKNVLYYQQNEKLTKNSKMYCFLNIIAEKLGTTNRLFSEIQFKNVLKKKQKSRTYKYIFLQLLTHTFTEGNGDCAFSLRLEALNF